MKKQFFYAALAIGMMSSCSSNDLPGNQAPEEQLPEEERVAIELGISSPNAKIEASTKGIGSVGGIETEGTNKWNGEELGVWMYKVTRDEYDNITEEPAPENDSDPTYIFKDLTFKAPSGTDKGTIQMIVANSFPDLYKVKYYPSKGAYSFYGYHLGGTTGTENKDTKTIKDITIDGTHDIMTAGTMEVSSRNYNGIATAPGGGSLPEDFDWATAEKQSFSAWSARRNIQPTLVFEHKLARLRFFVKAGDKTASTHYWNTSETSWLVRNKVTVESEDVTQAVQITSIKVKGLANKVDMTLAKGEDGKMVALAASETATRDDAFELKQKPETPGDNLTDLQAVAPTCWEDPTSGAMTDETYVPQVQVGESIMFLPESGSTEDALDIEIGVKQAVLDTYTGGTVELPTDPTYVVKSDVLKTTLSASDLTGSKFIAGNNYDIIITVYSYSRIEITAQLTAWGNGGSITTAPGDEF